uniref:MBG domain-containing protein n=1 Tax=Tenacibaculum agarivorans TaxID=1908389 RepID=UPI000B12131C
MKQNYTIRILRKIVTIFFLVFIWNTQAQFETEPNNTPDENGVITFTSTMEFFGNVSASDPVDYYRIAKSPLADGTTVNMSVISRTGSRQIPAFLEERSGSYSGPIVSERQIHPGSDQSNRAFTLNYSSNSFYLIRMGKSDGTIVGGYAYRVNFPTCRVPFATGALTTTSFEDTIELNAISAHLGSYYVVKMNTIDNFTDPPQGFTTPTVDGTNYSGSGEQTLYFGSGTPNKTITNLIANTNYFFKVWTYADCNSGEFKRSNGTVFQRKTCGAMPATATALNLSANNESSSFISSFSGTTGASIRYVVKANTVNSFTAPINGVTLPTANSVYGGGEQVVYAGDSAAPNQLITGLTTGTEYFFKVYKAEFCGGNYYFESTGVGSSITPVCAPPNSNAGIYLFAEPTTSHNSMSAVNFTGGNNADGKIIYISDTNSFTFPTLITSSSLPVVSTDYTGKTGQTAIYTGAATGFRVTTTGLLPNTTYYFAAVNYKICNGLYYFFPTGIFSQNTTCGVTSELASNAVINNVDTTSFDLNAFTASTGTTNTPDGYVIKMNTVNGFTPLATGTTVPTGSTVYTGGEQVIYSGASTTPNLNLTGLTENTQYYFTIYGYKDCNGTPIYQQTGYNFSQSTLGLNFTPPTLSFGSAATTFNGTTTSSGTINYSLINDTTSSSLIGDEFTPGNVGSVTVRATVPANGIYKEISKDYTLTITKGTPVITWNSPATIDSGVPIDASYLNASANVAGIFEYYTSYIPSLNLLRGRITEGVTTLNTTSNIRNLYVRFIPTDANYNLIIGSTPITVNAGSNVLEITPNDLIKALGTSDSALTYKLTQGGIRSGEVIWVPLKREPGETEGTYVISIDETAQAPTSFDPSRVCPTGVCIGYGRGYIDTEDFGGFGSPITNGDYDIQLKTGNFVITGKEQVTINLNPISLRNTVYNATQRDPITIANIIVTNSGGAPVTTPVVNFEYAGNDFQGNSYGPSTVPPKNAGNYNVTATVDASDANYFGSVVGYFNILQHTITLTPDNPQVKLYDGLPKMFDVEATGLSGENIPLTVRYQIGRYFGGAPPIELGTYPVSIGSNGSVNYNVFYNGSLTITDKIEVTINIADVTHEFDGTQKLAVVNSIETSPGVAATPEPAIIITYEGINGTNYNRTTTPPTSGGEYRVFAYVDTTDANFFGSTNATLTIFEKENITFNVDESGLTYNGVPQGPVLTNITDSNDVIVMPTYTVSYSGSDVDDIDYGPSTTPPTRAGSYTARYMVSDSDPLYKGSDNVGFEISRVELDITVDPKTKEYGDADPELTYQITSGSLVGSDMLTGDLTRDPGESINDYVIDQGTLTAGPNYLINFNSNELTITERAIEVTVDAKSKVYGDSDPALTYQITSGSLAGSDAFIGDLTRVSGENVGDYTINQGTLGINSNYAISFVSADLSITARVIEVTADVVYKTYGEVDPVLSYKITTGTVVDGDLFTGSLERAIGDNAGDYTVNQGTLTLGSNYDMTFVSGRLRISRKQVNFSLENTTKVYGEIDPLPNFSIVDGTTPAYDDVITLKNVRRVAGENVGTYAFGGFISNFSGNFEFEITSSHSTDVNNYTFNFRSYGSPKLTITKKAIEVTVDNNLTKVYNNRDPELTFKVTSGTLVGSDTFNGSLSRVTGEDVGTYTINQGDLSLSPNYDLTFVGNDFEITPVAIEITVDTISKRYGDSDPALTYQITSGSLLGSDTLTGNLSREVGEDAGTYAITQGTLNNTNYTITFIGNDFIINKRMLLVIGRSASKIYGDSDPVLSYMISPPFTLVAGDALSGTPTRVSGEDVGFYMISQGTVSAGPNYDLTFLPGNLTIDKKQIEITANDNLTKVYNNADPELTYQITSGALVGTDTFNGSLARAIGEDVGTYAINQGDLVLNSNYNLTFVGNDFEITPIAIEVTADAKSKAYGDIDPTLTYTITSGSLASSDTFAGTLARISGEDAGTYAINQGDLNLSSNYNMTFVTNDFTINKKDLLLFGGNSKVYGETDPELRPNLFPGSLLVSGDAFSGSLVRESGEDVGNYTISLGTLSAGPNYNISFITSPIFNIREREIEVTADIKTKVEGEVDPVLTYQITSGSLVGSDAFTGNLERNTGEAIGDYTITQGTLTLGANYQITFLGNTFSITRDAVARWDGNTNSTWNTATNWEGDMV